MKKTLGMMIAELRKEHGMTQIQLAEKMGVTDKAVSKWERDLSCPDINALPHLAALFNISVDELMQLKKDASAPRKRRKELIDLILKAVALAMGIAVVVLSVLNKLAAESGIVLLGIGMTCIGISSFHKNE
ncbi:helix-turn-helix domain-containing protein [uncultured Oscillibacter sp.]|uniref:helix-turn-helix domain-containing protein n=1 Tax=uncultured Oscillibacter sp. TaxID=876091 RepID=UPI0025D510A9|nr:helix-turn-helix transcriptional regulator [uncultured Oscillibacter sp.]